MSADIAHLSRLVLTLCAALAGCSHNAPIGPKGPPKFTVGGGYQSKGEWLYPFSFASYDKTGLGEVIQNTQGAATADNEAYNPNALVAASPVLQLPAIVTITNLQTGRSVDVRVNDRGPDDPGRIIAISPYVASLLGASPNGTFEAEVKLQPRQTDALDATLGQGPKLAAAPEAGITAQSLGPPGATASMGASQNLTPQDNASSSVNPEQLSGQVTVSSPSPAPLYVQVPGFGTARDAHVVMDQLAGMPARTVPVFNGDRTLYAVQTGPYESTNDADAALQQVLARGVPDPEIIVH